MENFIVRNIGAIISGLISLMAVIIGWVRMSQRYSDKLDSMDMTVADTKRRADELERIMTGHMGLYERHVDPQRDREWRENVMRQLDNIAQAVSDLQKDFRGR